MSRLWRDRLLVSLAPGAVALLRVAGGLRPQVIAKHAVDCDPAFGAEPWQGAVAALAEAAGPMRGERLDATVVLSNHFVRYALVEIDSALAGEDEQLALARFHFSRIYGERAKGWDVRLSDAPRGAPRMASAVDAGLIPAIRECFPRGGKARLVSVQPYLMSAFNCWRSLVAKEDGWLLLVEPERMCLALVAADKWAAVQTLRGEFAQAADWAELIDRQQLRAGADPAAHTVHVHAPASAKAVAREANGWKILGLTLPALAGFSPLEDGRYAMALTAQ